MKENIVEKMARFTNVTSNNSQIKAADT